MGIRGRNDSPPYYFANKCGRKPIGIETMLCMYLMQIWFKLSDAGSGYVHIITDTYANMHDVSETANLIREDDKVVYGNSRYLGAVNQPTIKGDEKKSKIEFRVNKRPSSLKLPDDFKGLNWDKKMEHEKSAIRGKGEHPFLIVKKQMGNTKVVYCGIAIKCIDSICCLPMPIYKCAAGLAEQKALLGAQYNVSILRKYPQKRKNSKRI